MAKFTNYILLLSGFFLIFYLFGLNNGITGALFDILLNPSSVQSLMSSGALKVLGVFVSALGIGLTAVAFITRSYFSESMVLLPLIPLLLSFIYDFIAIYNTVASASTVLALLVLSPFILLYVFTVIEWWRGVST